MSQKIRLAERPYVSIQGEGVHTGRSMLFVRLSGCRTSCWWCDTRYAQELWQTFDPETLWKLIEGFNCKDVWLTGGEPLDQADALLPLIEATHCNVNWYLCTSGTTFSDTVLKLVDNVWWVTIDYKLRSALAKQATDLRFVNSVAAKKGSQMEIKFVVGRVEDFTEIQELLNGRPDFREHAVIQPMYDPVTMKPLQTKVFAEHFIREFRNSGVRFMLQQHKHIWPGVKRGV